MAGNGRKPGRPPRQEEKRALIVEAARIVLARDGLAGCTVRAVAEASPLTKSAIHYYFHDMDDLIDQAMSVHITEFARLVREAADRHEEPPARFWAAVDEYLAIFRDKPRSILLWIEYWWHSAQNGRLATVAARYQEVDSIFVRLLRELGVDAPDRRGGALNSFLLGVATRQGFANRPADALRAEITELCHLG